MALDPTKAFLGVGWAFPPALESNGSVADAVYEEDIRQAIEIIIFTNRGERVMRPEFGAGLNEFIFENVSTTTLALIETRVREALIAWEARIDIEQVSVTSDRGERNKLLIDLTYTVRATNSRHNLVFPFYLEEGIPS
ncbi:MAG TPA: GPW/gp25 family protein [Pyrinomonadaceae bacterium]|jgi:phage baseplate assembly protein W